MSRAHTSTKVQHAPDKTTYTDTRSGLLNTSDPGFIRIFCIILLTNKQRFEDLLRLWCTDLSQQKPVHWIKQYNHCNFMKAGIHLSFPLWVGTRPVLHWSGPGTCEVTAQRAKWRQSGVAGVAPGGRDAPGVWQVKQASAPPPNHHHQQHHHCSHIHVPHLSKQISGCVHSAVALYMNYEPACTYFKIVPFYQLEPPTRKCSFSASIKRIDAEN